jgi:hypothetical protein
MSSTGELFDIPIDGKAGLRQGAVSGESDMKTTGGLLEYIVRVDKLKARGMSDRAARITVDAAMYGLGCVEGTMRVKIQKELEEENGTHKESDSSPVHG